MSSTLFSLKTALFTTEGQLFTLLGGNSLFHSMTSVYFTEGQLSISISVLAGKLSASLRITYNEG